MVIELTAQKRDVLGKKVKELRRRGLIPAELYGRGLKNIHLAVPAREFGKVFAEAGKSLVVKIRIGGETQPVLIHDMQRHPLTGSVMTVDFYRVRMDEKVEAEVPVELVGEAPAVKEKDGVLVRVLHSVNIEALPADMPKSVQADISSLAEIGQSVHISDLRPGKSVKILNDPETVVAMVQEQAEEEAEKPEEEEAAAAAEGLGKEGAEEGKEEAKEEKRGE